MAPLCDCGLMSSSETGPGRAFMEEVSRARDHAVQLVENWMEGSLDPLFNHVNDISNKVGGPARPTAP